MPHHAGQLSLIVDRTKQAGIDEHGPSWQGEGVDGRIGDNLKGEGEPPLLRLAAADQAFSDPGDIFVEKRIADHDHLFTDLGSVLLAELYILRLREQVKTRMELGGARGPDQGARQDRDYCRCCDPFHTPPPAGRGRPPPTKCTISRRSPSAS